MLDNMIGLIAGAPLALQVSNSKKAMKFVRDGTCSGFISPGKTKPLALALAFARGRRAPQCADNARAQRSALTDEPSPAVGNAEFEAQFQMALPENCLPLGSCGVAQIHALRADGRFFFSRLYNKNKTRLFGQRALRSVRSDQVANHTRYTH